MRTAGRCCTTDGKTSSAPSTPPAASFTVSSLNPCPKRPASYPQIPRTSHFFDKTTFDTPFASGPYPVYGQRHEDQVIWLLSLNHTHNFSPNMINQLRGGLTRARA